MTSGHADAYANTNTMGMCKQIKFSKSVSVHCIVEIELIVRLELIVLQKGFPTDQTLDDLLEYFDEFGGESVSLRRDAKRLFKVCFYIKVCNLQIMFNFII